MGKLQIQDAPLATVTATQRALATVTVTHHALGTIVATVTPRG